MPKVLSLALCANLSRLRSQPPTRHRSLDVEEAPQTQQVEPAGRPHSSSSISLSHLRKWQSSPQLLTRETVLLDSFLPSPVNQQVM